MILKCFEIFPVCFPSSGVLNLYHDQHLHHWNSTWRVAIHVDWLLTKHKLAAWCATLLWLPLIWDLSTCMRTLTLKRPGLCGWLRPTQFKPRLDWVGSAAQVRRYCVDSAAQAFIHALTGCVPRSLQYALCGPRNSRPAHFAAHALDVLASRKSPSLTQLST